MTDFVLVIENNKKYCSILYMQSKVEPLSAEGGVE